MQTLKILPFQILQNIYEFGVVVICKDSPNWLLILVSKGDSPLFIRK